MVNNSTNINKANNYLSPQTIEYKKNMKLEIQILAWDRQKNVAGLSSVSWIPNLPLW